MTIKSLNPINKPILVFGGPYSNLEALESLRSFASSNGITPDRIICTGDIVGYCGHPSEALNYIEDWGIHCIAGNVELNIRNGEEECGCNFDEGSRCDVFSRQWYPYAFSKMTERNLNYINSLPEFLKFKFYQKEVFVLHGSKENTSEFIFKSTPSHIKKDIIQACQADIIFAGHSGIPFHQKFEKNHWINAGVIGMPANDGRTNTWFVIIDLDNTGLKCEFNPLTYDHRKASKHMEDQNLPLSYANTLNTGIWDNCEILPEIETRQQGKPLEL